MVCCSKVLAADSVYVNLIRHFNEQNGLHTSNIYHLMEDANGRLWISSDRGVSVYDGIEFESFTPDNGLADYEILSTFQASDSTIWTATFNGDIGYYHKGHFIRVSPRVKLPHFGPIRALSEVGNNLVVTPVRGSSVVLNDSFEVLFSYSGSKYPHTLLLEEYGSTGKHISVSKNDMVSGQIEIKTPNASRVFRGEFQGAPFYNGDRSVLLFRENENKETVLDEIGTRDLQRMRSVVLYALKGEVPLSLLEVGNTLLIGTRNGLFVFDRETLEPKAESFENTTVTSIVKLKDGSLWLSTLERGVFEFSLDQYIRKVSEEPAFRFVRADSRLFACGVGQVLELDDNQVATQVVDGVRERITDVQIIGRDLLLSSGIGIFRLSSGKTIRYTFGGGSKDMEKVGNTLFVGAYNGIYVWPLDKLSSTTYKPKRVVTDRANTICWNRGNLLFGNERGVYHLDTSEHNFSLFINYSGRVNRVGKMDNDVFIATSSMECI